MRQIRPDDFPRLSGLSRRVYPHSAPWREAHFASHTRVFPEGQLVAVDPETDEVLGMAASLIILWDDYHLLDTWQDFTDGGWFTNHDPEHGHTLYGAEVMVDPEARGRGVGKALYAARRDLCRRLGLLRIRAGARLPRYHLYADRLTPVEYVIEVVRGHIDDPTLCFQLAQGFRVLAVVRNYDPDDPDSLGHAAVIEWLNDEVATPEDAAGRDPRFEPPAGLWPMA
ncbi:MAG: GNAT family N-acetyltransferase [Myxococcota bacterium]